MIPKIFHRLRRYIETMIWIRKKEKEIKDAFKYIDMNLTVFARRRLGFDSRDGTRDVTIQYMYQLRGLGKILSGSSIEIFVEESIVLRKAQKVLYRFKKRTRNKGWFYDKMAANEKKRKVLRKQQEAITTQFNGIASTNSDVSIPN